MIMSEQTSQGHEVLPEYARIDLRTCIGAFMLFDQAHTLPINRNAKPTLLATKADVAGILPVVSEFHDTYQEVRQEFIDQAPSGLPKHEA